MRRLAFAAIVVALSFSSVGTAMAQSNLLVNGDFATGDLTGWTTFTTDHGTLGPPQLPRVEPFDLTAPGISSPSVQFQVGYIGVGGGDQGGGIFQDVNLSSGGTYSLSADIAASSPGVNAQGGDFELLFDGTVVASDSISLIDVNQIIRGELTAVLSDVTPGTHQGPRIIR